MTAYFHDLLFDKDTFVVSLLASVFLYVARKSTAEWKDRND